MRDAARSRQLDRRRRCSRRCAILLLPRQFHVTVVENATIAATSARAAWLFPAYLVLINLFVAPLAIAGLPMFPDGAIDRDLTVLALPLSAGAHGLALTTMLGGLSAATGMVVVDSVALAITVSNDLVMPILLRGAPRRRRAAAGEIGARVLSGPPPRDPRRADARLSLRAADRRRRRSPRSACCPSPRSRRSRRPFSAGSSGGAARRAARSPGMIGGLAGLVLPAVPALARRRGRARRLPRPRAARRRLAAPGRAGRLLAPIRWSAASRFRSAPTSLAFVVVLADAQGDAARTDAGDRFRRRDAGGKPQAFRLWRASTTAGELEATVARYLGAERARQRVRDVPCASAGSTRAPSAGGRRASDPPRRASALAGDRRLDLAPGAVAAAAAAAPCRASRR